MNHSATLKQLTTIYLLCIGAGIAVMGIAAYLIVNFSFETYASQLDAMLGDTHSTTIIGTSNEIIETRLDNVRNGIFILSALAAVVAPFAAFLFAKRRLQPVLAAAERQKQFISNASHELRTPLAVLTGELDLALKKDRNPEDYRSALLRSKEEVVRLTTLTNQLLLLSRLDEGDRLAMRSVKLKELLETVLQTHAFQIKQKNLTVDTQFISSSLVIEADADLLKIALSNLIDNAVKYSPAQKKIEVSLDKMDAVARIAIVNEGVKLSKQEVAHVFERFGRTGKSNTQGFGLGLAITKSIIDCHKGRIEFISEEGSTKVEVKLPLAAQLV